MSKFYNSIRLLGEFYNKARISNGNPINILSTSLLNLLNVELEKELKNVCHFKNDQFSELLLGQVSYIFINYYFITKNISFRLSLMGHF
jgi:hypothetical protein